MVDAAVLRISACEGKKVFETYTAAEKQARRQSARKKGGAFAAYVCRICKKFHVGTRVARGEPSTTRIDMRGHYAVWARNAEGVEIHLGYSNRPDGGTIKEMIPADWEITRVVERY